LIVAELGSSETAIEGAISLQKAALIDYTWGEFWYWIATG
jgi:hypothetical protein